MGKKENAVYQLSRAHDIITALYFQGSENKALKCFIEIQFNDMHNLMAEYQLSEKPEKAQFVRTVIEMVISFNDFEARHREDMHFPALSGLSRFKKHLIKYLSLTIKDISANQPIW